MSSNKDRGIQASDFLEWPQVVHTEVKKEGIAMYAPSKILSWVVTNVEGMRLSRCKTLASIVSAALVMQGVGVLALGRSMSGEVAAKHCIKRVWRFLRNSGVEVETVQAALFACLAPRRERIVVLVDWTDLEPYQKLVFALPRDGRALPFLWVTVKKGKTEAQMKGSMIEAERQAWDQFASFCPAGRKVVFVADRGFGHARWMADVQNRGWHFVQRMSHVHQVFVDGHTGTLKELGIRRGWRARDWGWGTLNEQEFGPIRLVTMFDRDHEEAWYLVTSLEVESARQVVGLYQRRMWIEAMFRDLKNRDWGLGLDMVRLSEPERHDRHFCIIALAYVMLCAFGAAAESLEIDKRFKANTSTDRVMNLARIGNYFIQIYKANINQAFKALRRLPT